MVETETDFFFLSMPVPYYKCISPNFLTPSKSRHLILSPSYIMYWWWATCGSMHVSRLELKIITLIMMLMDWQRQVMLIIIFSSPHGMSSSLANPQIILKCPHTVESSRLLMLASLLSTTIAATYGKQPGQAWEAKPLQQSQSLGLTPQPQTTVRH